MKRAFLIPATLIVLIAPRVVFGASNALVLTSRTITWQPGISTQLTAQVSQNPGQRVPAFVKFNNPLSLTNHHVLQMAGVHLEDYLGESSYALLLPTNATAVLSNNVLVQSMIFAAEPVLTNDKLQLISTNIPYWAHDLPNNTVKLLVGFWGPIDRATVTNDLGSLGLTGIRYGADNSWAVKAPLQPLTNFTQILINLAGKPSVKVIQFGPLPFLPLNDHARTNANTNPAHDVNLSNPKPYYNKVSGQDVRIAICDDGIYEAHRDFRKVTAAGAVTGTRIYRSRPAQKKHGTHVASIAAGNGFNSAGNFYAPFRLRGHGPEALIGDYPTNFGANADLHYQAIATDGTDVINHSYVQSYTVYDLHATGLDEAVRGTGKNSAGQLIPARPSVWAAGNNGFKAEYSDVPAQAEKGYYGVYTSAKNTISVGSVDTETGLRSHFSSLSPTFDGRIKPDVVAPGCRKSISFYGIMAAAFLPTGTGGQAYRAKCGTSMAAPVVTGIIALMMQQYNKSCVGCPELPPSMYKAILIHTAHDLVKTMNVPTDNPFPNPDTSAQAGTPTQTMYDAGPDFATGYGLVNAEEARKKIEQAGHYQQGTITLTTGPKTWSFAVDAGDPEVKVVIAWDDPPGPVHTAQNMSKLVNDLDLQLTDPMGNTYYPWTLDPLPLTEFPGSGAMDPIPPASVAAAKKTGPDRLNNVEMVTVTATATVPLTPGTWQATVTGFTIAFPAGQLYSLVGSHALSP